MKSIPKNSTLSKGYVTRIIAVADAYGAMTTNRPYRKASSTAWALDELRRYAGTQFDPKVVDALEHVLTTDLTLVGSAV